MRFFYKNLQKYFEDPLPPVADLVEAITMHAFEVEAVEEKGGDAELEIKILSDRAADAKSDLGLARELSAILSQPLKTEYESLPTRRTARAEIIFTPDQLNQILGLEFSESEITAFLRRARVVMEAEKERGQFVALIPAERQDLNLAEDLADEVGRLYGVNKILSIPLPPLKNKPEWDKNFLLKNKIRELLIRAGFTEVYGYTFSSKGELAVEKPLAQDKAFLRTNLTDGLKEKIVFNLQCALFDWQPVKIFELGTVFTAAEETQRLAIGVGYRVKKFKKEGIPEYFKRFQRGEFNDETIEIVEIDLAELAGVAELTSDYDLGQFIHLDRTFQSFSLFPRIIRDIALFVSQEAAPEAVGAVIKDAAGSLLAAGPVLFDEFKKDGKKSLAFRLVFQSHERTLADNEINQIVAEIITALESRPGWQVRK